MTDESSQTEASTTSGSRTFGGTFVIEWTPGQTGASLNVQVTAGGSLLTAGDFTPDDATKQLAGNNDTFSFQGTFVAGFNAAGTSGTLLGQKLTFIGPSGTSIFNGVVGVW